MTFGVFTLCYWALLWPFLLYCIHLYFQNRYRQQNKFDAGINITVIVSLNNVSAPALPTEAILNAEGKDYIFVVTDKKPLANHDEGNEEHMHEEELKNNVNFGKIEIVKGVSNMGYMAIILVQKIPSNA